MDFVRFALFILHIHMFYISDFGASRKDENAVRQDFINEELQRLVFLRHEGVAVNGGKDFRRGGLVLLIHKKISFTFGFFV